MKKITYYLLLPLLFSFLYFGLLYLEANQSLNLISIFGITSLFILLPVVVYKEYKHIVWNVMITLIVAFILGKMYIISNDNIAGYFNGYHLYLHIPFTLLMYFVVQNIWFSFKLAIIKHNKLVIK